MLEGIVRESIGKKSAKALKRDGYLIANIYAKGLENVNAAFKTNEFIKFVRDKENLAFDIKVGANTYKVVVEEYQKHPVTNMITHVDLRVVLDDLVSKYYIPVKVTGIAKGLKNKGVLVQSKRRLPVQCAGKDLPNAFVLDVTELDTGDSILVRDIQIPQNVTMLESASVAVVGVLTAK
ncbi:50S ribosomal protein L25/general stress protein Ctc [Campylobacter geochelonis]|uniref:Large ribosomal subunit protein bL25 n=1 Tax=Campylobacter geochelonis TaxID=1780362 RepID=A0A128ENV9_9BACT|nr:50S ribosomal protein L25/general stress protein Ctc [Campylobacter geochelonis]QKF70623.1 50S ribosomal protein L25 [Campylobacter geochelonis]CZE45911.1 50S ribosomal protein L25/general stress protein Ctc [Campylobacter geochelonis]CZE46727.1 50S ribosomal protein L25/general stress protein Ctc [Campylobacter geochelonis]CZE50334.1 50S ribosomal protein L25/general stress protein Ctc [Campylobacter geochelonis]